MPQPRDSLAPAAHGPSPAQPLHAPQLQVASQSRVDIPQLPQSRDSIVPGMQVPGSAPHARHMPVRQLSPAEHGVPAQQGSPTPPHAWQVPAAHMKPVLQASPAQHGSPARPQVRQLPPVQTSTPLQAGGIAQHGPSANPQPEIIPASRLPSRRPASAGGAPPSSIGVEPSRIRLGAPASSPEAQLEIRATAAPTATHPRTAVQLFHVPCPVKPLMITRTVGVVVPQVDGVAVPPRATDVSPG
jgi:hypothetical protein